MFIYKALIFVCSFCVKRIDIKRRMVYNYCITCIVMSKGGVHLGLGRTDLLKRISNNSTLILLTCAAMLDYSNSAFGVLVLQQKGKVNKNETNSDPVPVFCDPFEYCGISCICTKFIDGTRLGN